MFAPVEEETPETGREQRPGVPLEPVRFVWAIHRKSWLIALAVALSIPLGLVVAFTLAPREYVAQSVLVWEPVRAGSAPARELQTLTNSVKLPTNLEEVRRRLQLTDRLEEVGGRVRVGLVSNESNILTISGRAGTAEEAAQFTQTVTDVFLEARVRIARTRTEERLKALTEEIEQLLAQLASARERYDRFRSQHRILDLALDRKSAIEELALLSTEVNKNRIEADSGAVKENLLRAAVHKASPQIVVLENQVQADRQKLAELSAQLTARRASLSEDHPEVLGLEASVEALEQKPANAYTVTGRQLGANPEWMLLQEQLTSTAAAQKATEHKWQSYARLKASLDERLLQLTAVEGEASLLLSDVQVTEHRLGQLKADQKVLEAEFRQPAPELRVLSAPVPPPWPAQSARRKVALAFPVLTGLLVVLFLVGLEFRGLRMRTPSEIAFWANAPVLASSSWPAEPEELRNLTLELAPQLEAAVGKTLLVPLAPSLSGRAAELVAALRAHTPATHPAQEGALALWDSADRRQALRRASRESSHVLVLVEGAAHSSMELAGLRRMLGRDDGIGLVVLGLGPELALLPDRVGDVPGFWSSPLPRAEAMPPPEPGTLKELHPLEHRRRSGRRR